MWGTPCSKRLNQRRGWHLTFVSHIDFQTSIESRADHLMDISSVVNKAAGTPRQRMGKHITLTKERNDPFEDRTEGLLFAPLSGGPQSVPKST